jgi:hypothetical protein
LQKWVKKIVKHKTFDPALDAPTVLKERFVWMLFMGILFFLLYGAANQWASLSGAHPSVAMEWEKNIPFIPAFIVPYMSSDLMFIIAFFLPYTRIELRVLAARVLFIILFSVVIFILFPLRFEFDKPHTESFSFLFGMLQADLPYNQLPSLHISFAVILWASMKKHLTHTFIRYFVVIWFWLIALSTLFVYQHHFLDLPTGAIVGIVALYLIREDKKTALLRSFMTPRSLKMGLYYLLGAGISMVFAFIFPQFLLIFLWLFIALFGVGIAYAFGINTLLANRNSRASPWQLIAFFPYFLGNYLSWQYYKRKLLLISQVAESVYLGRMPSKNEYKILKEKNIGYVINLAIEQQIQKAPLPQIRLAFLDQTIHSPEALHEGVMLIEANKDQGVFIHCALGLSRSVLLVSAWLMYLGHSLQEARGVIQNIRPNRIESPYMDITLQLYAKHLTTLDLKCK